MKAPSPKSQVPNSKDNSILPLGTWNLELEIWDLKFVSSWGLEFEIWGLEFVLNNTRFYSVLCIVSIFLSACGTDYVPKPKGFFRIDLPEKQYTEYRSDCPFSFEHPTYAKVSPYTGANTMPCWINIDYPKFQGRLHLSYFAINNNIEEYLEDSRSLAYKHTVKAEAIDEKLFIRDVARVYGVLYEIEGVSTASSVQFFLTDSTTHFLRGALYFNISPRNDSLAPVINFIKEDIYHLIETFEWK